MTKELTGRHVLIIAIVAFGTIIAANMAMLLAATGTFPGLVVKNSYVEGVGWNARSEAQEALGWAPEIVYSDGAVTIDLKATGTIKATQLELIVGRPSIDGEDIVLTAKARGDVFRVPVELAPGKWRIELRTLSGPQYRSTAALFVPEPR
ncbi:MAG: FixH family protein [Pseudomonadota bacterium]